MTAPDEHALGLDDVLAEDISTYESQTAGVQLYDHRQRLTGLVAELVAAEDVTSLRTLCVESRAAHKVLRLNSSRAKVGDLAGEPFLGGDRVLVHAARALAALGLALVDDQDHAVGHLRVFQRWMEFSGVRVSAQPVDVPSTMVETPHAERVRHLAATAGLDPLSLVWLAELDGWRQHGGAATVRGGPSTRVLLDLGSEGRSATLSLSVAPGLPSAMVPDPATMALASADDAFRSALAAAWEIAGGRGRGTVLWSLCDPAGPVLRVGNESLGAAFTVLLDEVGRLRRRVRGPLTVRRLRSRNAIVGRVDVREPAAVKSVSGYDTKLLVVDEKTRVILPREDHRVAAAANNGGAELVPVDTWRQAAKIGRAMEKRRLLTITASVLVVAVGVALGLYQVSESGRGADQRRATAADLAARSIGLRQTDPTLAAKLGLAAHRIDGGNSRAVDAMRDVLAGSRNVVRTWQADPSRVDSVAVSEKQDLVVTSGSDGLTKVWTLSSGEPRGELPRHSYRMAAARTQALAVAETSTGLLLYDLGGRKPTELGALAKPSCTDEEEIADFGFIHADTTVVVVWKDGAITTSDVVTREQLTCLTWQEALSPVALDRPPVEKVLDADVATGGPGAEDDEVVTLLSDNRVVSVRLATRDARVEVAADRIVGDASLVTASGDMIGVGTESGVAAWSRKDGSLLANPVGGVTVKPRVLAESNGHLLISGDDGTVVAPLAVKSWVMAKSLSTPSGGAATVAAINDRAIVAGGPGGRISVIADSSGELALAQRTLATAMTFLPDGKLIVAEAPGTSASRSAGTDSVGLTLVDPQAPPSTDTTTPETPRTQWIRGPKQRSFYANDVLAEGDVVASAGLDGNDGVVFVWKGENHDSPATLSLPTKGYEKATRLDKIIAAIGFTPDRKLMVGKQVSGQVGIWDVESLRLLGTVDLKPGNSHMSVQEGRAILVEGEGEDTAIVEVDLAKRLVTRRTPAPRIVQLDMVGSTAITVTEDGAVQQRGADMDPVGDPLRPSGSGEPTLDASLDPAGGRVAISTGSKVYIYDLAGKTLSMPPFDVDGNDVMSVVWSPDGQLLAGSVMPPKRGNKQVIPIRVWKTGGMDWTSQVCRWAGGGLSRDEWSRYVGTSTSFIDLCAEVRK
jgi:WD40 repeat protein